MALVITTSFLLFLGLCPFIEATEFTEYQFFLTFSTISNGNTNFGTAASQFKSTFMSSVYENELGMLYDSNSANEGPLAAWVSEVSVNADNTFSERGNISFTPASVLHFESATPGISHEGPGSTDEYGTISYEITGGEGAFSNAQGWMVDMFIADGNSLAFQINAALIVWVPQEENHQEENHQEEKESQINTKNLHSSPPPVLSRTPPLKSIAPIKDSDSYQRVEFALIFTAHPINGYNHGVAITQTISTLLTGSDSLPLELSLFNNTDETNAASLYWLSHSTSFDNGTFANTGNLTLIDDISGEELAQILFINDGLGSSNDGPTSDGSNYGGIGYQITGGSGLWANAQGGFVDMFVSTGDDLYFPINALGVFWVPI